MSEPTAPKNFIREIIDADLESGKHKEVVTRFPPEPNGYLHIGHAKSICLNFGIARDYGQRVPARCHLRFDDTNPTKEETEYVESIKTDVRWMGFDWGEHQFYASDYFEKLYECAVKLIEAGKAYVDSQTAEEIRANRGTLTEPGTDSPYRERSIDENLDLFTRMRAGEFEDGTHVLRAKIDMASPNVIMRDPTLWRIRHAHHHRTGDAWCIYPMYDFTHCLSDSFEGVTHSLCTLEFENNRELYDWVLDALNAYHPRQYEFARLNMTYTVLSKRRLIQLVQEGHVSGWDDPRMPTLSGYRRRGYSPEAIRMFCDRIGVAKADNLVEIEQLEACLREDLNAKAPRMMAVLDPIKLTIENYPDDQVEMLTFDNMPDNEEMGTRQVPFTKRLWIERGDFREEAPRKWFRLAPGKEVRLRYAYYVTCKDVIKDADGNVVELICTYDPATKGGWSEDGRKVKGTLHWVSVPHAKDAEVRLYDRLFSVPNPMADKERDFKECLNPDSLQIAKAKVEPALDLYLPGDICQFERIGYFCCDKDSKPGAQVFNRSVGLRDSWAKQEKKK